MVARLILNGNEAVQPPVREAIHQIRERVGELEVRATFERGDARRFAHEACADGVERVIAGGGDGTLNEVVNGLMAAEASERPSLGIMPLGTANDFASSCLVPLVPLDALALAVTGTTIATDVGRINDLYFLNSISTGFGAAVTASTPPGIKKALGGAAYSLVGLIMALNFEPFDGQLQLPDGEITGRTLVLTAGNGRQAGGGQPVAPKAFLDDGLLDLLVIREFGMGETMTVMRELDELSENGTYVSYHQVPWLETRTAAHVPINIDGEPVSFESARIEAIPGALALVLPPQCPLFHNTEAGGVLPASAT